MPIDLFGKNILSKFGWVEGKGIGRNQTNAIVQPIEYIHRPIKLGLGAKPSALQLKKKKYEELEKSTEGGKNYKSIHETLKVRDKMGIGSEVYIVSGIHKDMQGKIRAVTRCSMKQ